MEHLNINKLTKRENEILVKISFGFTINEIANLLFLSPHTIISYKRNLLRKLDAKNTAGLVREGFEKGFLNARIQQSIL